MSANIRARNNREYLRRLLGERQPAFAAMLQAVERQIDQELSRGATPGSAHPYGRRPIMNTARLYHLDSSLCVDGWSCREQDHTSVPPRCGAPAADWPIGCELPKGHPGPHVHVEDRKCRVAGNGINVSRMITGTTGRQQHLTSSPGKLPAPAVVSESRSSSR